MRLAEQGLGALPPRRIRTRPVLLLVRRQVAAGKAGKPPLLQKAGAARKLQQRLRRGQGQIPNHRTLATSRPATLPRAAKARRGNLPPHLAVAQPAALGKLERQLPLPGASEPSALTPPTAAATAAAAAMPGAATTTVMLLVGRDLPHLLPLSGGQLLLLQARAAVVVEARRAARALVRQLRLPRPSGRRAHLQPEWLWMAMAIAMATARTLRLAQTLQARAEAAQTTDLTQVPARAPTRMLPLARPSARRLPRPHPSLVACAASS